MCVIGPYFVEWQLIDIIFSEWWLFWIRGGGWGWVGVYVALFFVGDERGWVGHYFGWVGVDGKIPWVGGGEWG